METSVMQKDTNGNSNSDSFEFIKTFEELKKKMNELDMQLIRPMGAMLAGKQTDEDVKRFNELIAEKEELRIQIQSII